MLDRDRGQLLGTEQWNQMFLEMDSFDTLPLGF
jgi:hypothetical protein